MADEEYCHDILLISLGTPLPRSSPSAMLQVLQPTPRIKKQFPQSAL